jgi:hypothetical protein
MLILFLARMVPPGLRPVKRVFHMPRSSASEGTALCRRRCSHSANKRKEEIAMKKILAAAAAAALLAAGATLASAQSTNKDSPSKAEPGAPTQGPGQPSGTGSRPMGPPAAAPAAPQTTEKSSPSKSEAGAPQQGPGKQVPKEKEK